MQLTLNLSDIQSAPTPVRDWFLRQLAPTFVAPTVAEALAPKVEPVVEQPTIATTTQELTETNIVNEVKELTMKDVLEKAVAFAEAKGPELLKQILTKLGIKRVKECPQDKFAALLAEIAIHA